MPRARMLLRYGGFRGGSIRGCTQGAVARGLASLGVEFSEEAVEPVTGYRVDMLLLRGGDGGAAGRCAVEVRASASLDMYCMSI